MQRTPFTRRQRPRSQRGISLIVVIVFVMLSMLLALWASRTALFNEMVVGNDADYQRAFEAAQALLQDAELDIRGERANGSACEPVSSDTKICRRDAALMQIPLEAKEVAALLSDLKEGISGNTPRCRDALCIKRTGRQDFWNNKNDNTTEGVDVTLTQMMADTVGARYGQYTGAQLGDTTNPANPILADRSANNQGGWYWIEVLPYDANAGNSALIAGGSANLALNLQPNVVYRITAVAHGRKPNSQVVLQQTYARQKLKD